MSDQQHDESSTSPSEEERERVDDLPSGAGSGDEPDHQDPTSGGAPEQPER
ncbi:hypothetical protein [Agrococcus sp. SGAir0287]|uniref:hypothetical protein n=1 Tax=Agrococcus sp. SGAir0287 TaxID=2070347 RepID=UPI001586DA89|nr:hypothetical protein [Agrococcus sp. SGAir0287]